MCSSFPGLLIGRTAVHSGKDPAFVAYDQFLSTGILQPPSRGEVRCGSNSALLRCPLKCPICPTADMARRFMGSKVSCRNGRFLSTVVTVTLNFALLEMSHPEVVSLVTAMPQARDAVERRSWAPPQEPTGEEWWADV